MERETQIEKIYQLIMELASGNLTYRAPILDGDDELNAITIGINMLAEELQTTTVSKDYLGRIFKGIVDILIVINSSNTIEMVNEAACRILGYTEYELLNQPVSILLYRNDERSLQRISGELEKKGYIYNVERVFKTKKGKAFPVSLSCSKLLDSTGKSQGSLFIAKDITKIKRTEEQLISKNEELNTLLYRASHDLKGPLASVMGLVSLAKAELEQPEVLHYLKLIDQATRRLDSILMDFLELGRLTQLSTKYQVIEINPLIEEILASLTYLPEFAQTSIEAKISLTKEFKSRKNLVQAIIHNLIENAIKYHKPDIKNHRIQIEVKNLNHDIIFKVSDTGLGMNKMVQDNIFKMFYRGHDESRGSGLGLYIVKTSVEALKGKIYVKSKPGLGSVFEVVIPNKA